MELQRSFWKRTHNSVLSLNLIDRTFNTADKTAADVCVLSETHETGTAPRLREAFFAREWFTSRRQLTYIAQRRGRRNLAPKRSVQVQDIGRE